MVTIHVIMVIVTIAIWQRKGQRYITNISIIIWCHLKPSSLCSGNFPMKLYEKMVIHSIYIHKCIHTCTLKKVLIPKRTNNTCNTLHTKLYERYSVIYEYTFSISDISLVLWGWKDLPHTVTTDRININHGEAQPLEKMLATFPDTKVLPNRSRGLNSQAKVIYPCQTGNTASLS